MASPTDVPARVELERLRVLALYDTVPPNRLALAAGLIEQAARLRVQLDDLAADIAVNGMTEPFQQSEKQEPYDRERPACAIFAKLDKNYQGIMARLDSMLPPQPEPPKPDPAADKLAAFVNDG
jgi:nitrate/nitrite-specific signal transduction histidine kinase